MVFSRDAEDTTTRVGTLLCHTFNYLPVSITVLQPHGAYIQLTKCYLPRQFNRSVFIARSTEPLTPAQTFGHPTQLDDLLCSLMHELIQLW